MRILTTYALFLLASNTCFAATSSFTVEGQVTAATCMVTNKDQNVKLPIAPRSTLQSEGDIYGKTPFSIEISGCPAGSFIYFESDPLTSSTISTSGRLENTAENGAENVQLQVLNSDGNAVNLNATKGQQASSAGIAVGAPSKNTEFKFFAQYYATGSATAGKVTSTVTFLVESL